MKTEFSSLVMLWCFGFFLPLIILMIGWVFKKYPSEKINQGLGYRTKRSMASEKAWKYANRLMAKIMIRGSLIIISMLIILMLTCFKFAGYIVSVSFIACIILVFCNIPIIEYKLKKFDLKDYNDNKGD